MLSENSERWIINGFTYHERTTVVTQDVVDVCELNCLQCGNPTLQAYCPEHALQDNAVASRGELLCVEWDYGRGDECQQTLILRCSACGGNMVEGLHRLDDDEEDE